MLKPWEKKWFQLCQNRTSTTQHTPVFVGEVAYWLIKLPIFLSAKALGLAKH